MDKLFNYKFNNGVVLKNRLVLAPMTTYASNEDLTLSDEEEIYYEARGKQFGMVITAATAVNKNAQAFPNQISIRDERYLESMTRLAKAIKKGGAKAILQLHHGGRMNMPNMYPNQEIVSASAVKANRDYTVTPRELRTSEVYDIIDDFSRAVKLAIQAGFDGIELHGANTYLIQQFFSPHSNKRTDEFGGDLEKRLRFPLELVQRAIEQRRKYSDRHFIIGYRLSPEELEDPGITIEDTLLLVDELSFKDIDYIHLSTGTYKQTSIRDKEETRLLIDRIKDKIGNRVPIMGVGRLETKESMDDALELGYELLAIGMPALADVNFVDNIEKGITPTKVIDESSLLPTKLKERMASWLKNSDRGYIVKKES